MLVSHREIYSGLTAGPSVDTESPSDRAATEMPPPWSIYLWPAVFCQAKRRNGTRFVHLGTRILSGGIETGRLAGQTMWCKRLRKREAGLLWDWAEISDGVLAMVDPMGVVTNLRLLSECGGVLTPFEAAPHLNQIVHQLPWQEAVWRSVKKIA